METYLNKSFDWKIEYKDYFPFKESDKMNLKDFMNYVVKSLDDYKKCTYQQVLDKPHNHSCVNLSTKSEKAKKLSKHLEKINERLGENETVILESKDIVQLKIKGNSDKDGFRCFGYIYGGVFHLVCVDPNHSIYEE